MHQWHQEIFWLLLGEQFDTRPDYMVVKQRPAQYWYFTTSALLYASCAHADFLLVIYADNRHLRLNPMLTMQHHKIMPSVGVTAAN